MGTVFSADGTAIGFDAWGDGPPLIMIDGATAHRAMSPIAAQVGALLRDDFRTYAYDRRGRGESGDTPPYSVQREIEDLAALIDEAGGPAFVCGFSSGAVPSKSCSKVRFSLASSWDCLILSSSIILAKKLPAFQYSNLFVFDPEARNACLRSSKSLLTSAVMMSRMVSSGQPMARRLAMYFL